MPHLHAPSDVPIRSRSLGPLAGALLLAAWGAGCGEHGGSDCPAGHHREGPACVPTFDECPGSAEVPLLGGGCQAVGVTACASGFTSDDGGGCAPLLPEGPCPPGTMEQIGTLDCQPVGVLACAPGFVADGEGGCDAVLPAGACAYGSIEQLGSADCQPLGDCGTGPWGTIEPEATAVYVDATYTSADADGSAARPLPTVSAAVAAAPAGGQVVIAAGEYIERLVLDRPVRLIGRCAEQVILRGGRVGNQDVPPVRLTAGASGSLVRGVTLTGQDAGLTVAGAQGVRIEEVQVIDTPSFGVQVYDDAEVHLVRVKVARTTLLGVYALGGVVTLEESVVRDTRPGPSDGRYGRGIEADCDPDTGACGGLSVLRSLADANQSHGIYASGTETSVQASVVRGTLEQPSDGHDGRGIETGCHAELGVCGRLEVTGSLVAENREAGLHTTGSDLVVTGTTVRDTRVDAADGFYGRGIVAICNPEVAICGWLEVTDSLLTRNRDTGIALHGVTATVTGSIVRDTEADVGEQRYGRGIEAGCDPVTGDCGRLDVTRSLISGNREVGLLSRGTQTTLVESVVRDTRPSAFDGRHGHGADALCDASGTCGSLAVTRSLIVESHDVGILAFGAELVVDSSVVRDTRPQESTGTGGRGLDVQGDPVLGLAGGLALTRSVIEACEDSGVFLLGTDAVVSGTTVRDIRPNTSGDWQGNLGQAIFAMCEESTGLCGSLVVTGSLVDQCHLVGVSAVGVPGRVEATVIATVLPRALDGRFGYGVQVEGLPGAPPFTFDVIGCAVRDADLAGIVYAGATGAVHGSRVSGADFSIVWTVPGWPPEIAGDNDLAADVASEPSLQPGISPAPAPPPLLPAE